MPSRVAEALLTIAHNPCIVRIPGREKDDQPGARQKCLVEPEYL